MKEYVPRLKTLPKYVTEKEISIILETAKKDSYRNFIMLTLMLHYHLLMVK